MSRIPDFLGSYRIARFIRAGSSTQIYEAIKGDGSGRYVLKILHGSHWGDRQEIRSLKHEYEVARDLDHPNVIRIHELVTEGKVAYLVLEQFSEYNMKQVLREKGPNVIWVNFPKIVQQCLSGLHHLHEKGWVHCDVKPDNFLLSDNAEVKLIDFTISQKATRGKLSGLFRKRGQIQGTRSYMAPEQIRAEPLDRQTDIYAFGCVLYELLSGRLPYTGDSPNDLLNKHLKAGIPSVQVHNSNVSVQMSDLVQRMMAKEPANRPRTMMDVLNEFRAIRPFRMAPRLEASAKEAE